MSIEHYVKVLRQNGYKLMLYLKVLDLDHIFPFFSYFSGRPGTNSTSDLKMDLRQ